MYLHFEDIDWEQVMIKLSG